MRLSRTDHPPPTPPDVHRHTKPPTPARPQPAVKTPPPPTATRRITRGGGLHHHHRRPRPATHPLLQPRARRHCPIDDSVHFEEQADTSSRLHPLQRPALRDELLAYARAGDTAHISEMFHLVRGNQHILDVLEFLHARPSRPAHPRRRALRHGPHRPPPPHRRTAVHGQVPGPNPYVHRRTPTRPALGDDLRRTARRPSRGQLARPPTPPASTPPTPPEPPSPPSRAKTASRRRAIRTAIADLLPDHIPDARQRCPSQGRHRVAGRPRHARQRRRPPARRRPTTPNGPCSTLARPNGAARATPCASTPRHLAPPTPGPPTTAHHRTPRVRQARQRPPGHHTLPQDQTSATDALAANRWRVPLMAALGLLAGRMTLGLRYQKR
ncbi:hypothetical protein BS35_001575 [Actinomadura glauciflava]|nr:hypothetical protein [Actinomadura glauciflava]